MGGRLARAVGDRLGWGADGDVGVFAAPGGWRARVRPVNPTDVPGGGWRVVLVSPGGREASRVRVNTATVAVRIAEDMVRRQSARARAR